MAEKVSVAAYQQALGQLTQDQIQQLNSDRQSALQSLTLPQVNYNNTDKLVDRGFGPPMPSAIVSHQEAVNQVRLNYVDKVMALAALNQAAQPAIPAPNPYVPPTTGQPQQPQNPIGGGVVNPNNPVSGGGGQQGPVNGGINIGGGVVNGGINNGGGVVGGGLVDYGPSINNGNVGGLGNTGVVYGPDGRPYSSVAAAIAAGVTNYSFTRPNAGGNGLIKGADNLVNIPNAATGNANPGALIANQNQQLFQRPTGVQLPPGVYNPFAV